MVDPTQEVTATQSGDGDSGIAPQTPSKNSLSWTLFLKELHRVIAEFDIFRKQDCLLVWADALTDIVRRLLKASNLLYANSDLLKNMEFRKERQRAVSSLARLVYLSKLSSFPFPPNNIEQRTRKQALVLIQHIQYLVLMLDTHNLDLNTSSQTDAEDAQFPDYFGMCKPLPSLADDPAIATAVLEEMTPATALTKQVLPFKKSFVYLDRDDFVQTLDYLSAHIVKTVATLLGCIMKDTESLLASSTDLLRTLGWSGQILCLVESLIDPAAAQSPPSPTAPGPTAEPPKPESPLLPKEIAKLYSSFEELLRVSEACCKARDNHNNSQLMNAVIAILQASEETCMGLKSALTEADSFRTLTQTFQHLLANSAYLRHTPLADMKLKLNGFYQNYAKATVVARVSGQLPTPAVSSTTLSSSPPQLKSHTRRSSTENEFRKSNPPMETSLPTPPHHESALGQSPDDSFSTYSQSTYTTAGDGFHYMPPKINTATAPHEAPTTDDLTERKSSFTNFAFPFMRRMRSRQDLADTGGRKRLDPVNTNHNFVLPSPESPLQPNEHWLLKHYSVTGNHMPLVSNPPTPPLPEVRRMRSDAGLAGYTAPAAPPNPAGMVSSTHVGPPLGAIGANSRAISTTGVRVNRQRSLDTLTALSVPRASKTLPDVQEEHIKPWFMSYDYHHDDITFNEHGQIITGTMEALVERLTLHDCSVDSEYISTFLLTFRSFCTPIRFLDILMTRFHLTPPEELTDSEHAEWAQQKKIPVRLRVINVIKTWLESYFFDDEDVACIQPLHEFIESTLRDTMSSSANRLAQLVESKQDCLNPDSSCAPARLTKSKSIDRMLAAAYASIPDTPPPSPRLQRSILHSLLDGLPISIYDIEPLEIARQLTLMDGRLFGAIRPHELIGQEFSKKDLSTATNVRAMTARSNRITAWVVVSVLSEPELKRRASALKYFLKVADALLILNNYNTLMAVACGLVYSAISRLHLTWKSLSGKYATLMKTLDSITDPDRNFATYRARIRQQPPPCLPFLGVYLTDLTFTDDGNQTFRRQSSADRLAAWCQRHDTQSVSSDLASLSHDGDSVSNLSVDTSNTAEESPKSFINFHKYFQTVRIIKEIQGFQVPYNLKDVPELQQHLLGDFERCFAHFEPASLYDISLRLEPRKNSTIRPTPLVAPQPTQPSASLLSQLHLTSSTTNLVASNQPSQPPTVPTPPFLRGPGIRRNTMESNRSQSSQAINEMVKHHSSLQPSSSLTSSKSTTNFADLSAQASATTSHSNVPFSTMRRQGSNVAGASASVVSNRGLAFGFMS
ncbi:hypothetical protein H4R33_005081 [Dimargaris cristalligena]|nr:hypothetical protein H4R33_005081 [Dimargaris cristalligena]